MNHQNTFENSNQFLKIYYDILKHGYLLFVLAILCFGILIFIFNNTLPTLMPLPAKGFWPFFITYIIGFLLIAGSVSIILKLNIRLFGLLFGVFFLLIFIVLHLPELIGNIKSPEFWTESFEVLALSGGGFLLSNLFSQKENGASTNGLGKVVKSGKYLFACLLIVVGIQHYMYAKFVATLVPGWIPAPLFWAYFVGTAFFAEAISIVLNIKIRLAASLSGLMFFIWVFIVHSPRVFARINFENGWESLFVALAMSGISFMIAEEANRDLEKSK